MMRPPSIDARTAAAVTLLLASCGGGGGADAPPPMGSAPTATLTAPAALARNLGGTINVTADASDDVAVASVEFQLDGAPLAAPDTTAPYAASFDSTAHASGQHVLRARARDGDGNVSPWSAATVEFGGSRSIGAAFTLDETWITGLANATAFAQAGDGRWFVAEQGGALRVVKAGALLPTPFVSLTVDSTGERGLIGVALHPDFASNGYVYVHYTSPQGGAHNRISRFVAAGDVAGGTEQVLVDLPTLSGATNHNGGALHFGADGKLYVGVGENANPARAQDTSNVFGKLLRFNDDGAIPSDNPLCATPGQLACAIWAYGLRNPFTFAVQPGTGLVHINDVGQGTWEEIDVGQAGANYGWPQSEGPDDVAAGITGPRFTYKHSDASPPGSGPGGFFTGFSIAGGDFYPDQGAFPAAYRGDYYFADFVSRFVARLDLGADTDNAAYAFAQLAGNPVDVRVGADGALYVLTRSAIARIAAAP